MRFPTSSSNYGRISSRSFVRYSALKNGATMKTGLGFVQDHWTCHHLIDRIRVPISVPVTMAISSIVCEI